MVIKEGSVTPSRRSIEMAELYFYKLPSIPSEQEAILKLAEMFEQFASDVVGMRGGK